MVRTLLFLGLIFSRAVFGISLQEDIDRSARILREFQSIPEGGIPREVLENARGIAVLSVIKGGFIFSGRIGSGLVVAKTSDGWSAPSAIGLGGAGWGLQIGGNVTDFVFVLNSQEAVEAFANRFSVALGGDISVAAGPIGRTAEANVMLPLAAIYAYSRSRGLFAGVSLQGTVIVQRREANEQFYGRPVSARELLYKEVAPPKSAAPLYQALRD